MRRFGIALAVVAGLLVVAVVAAVAAGFWQVRRGYPQYDGQVALAGLTGEVEVLRNAYGIPTIYADTAEDLFRAQGYVHAQDRFWQMDLSRLLTSGRLTEIGGEAAIETDTFIRSLGWRQIAEQEVGLLGQDARRYLQAYADGVNAWLDATPQGERGIQYTLLGVQGVERVPEPWEIADSLALIRYVAWDLRHNPDEEAERAILIDELGEERVAQLFPPFPYDEMGTILTLTDLEQSDLLGTATVQVPDAVPAAAVPALRSAASAIGSVPGTSSRGGVGSNSWVVAADRTASGGALLANDPHLGAQIPALFTQMTLRCREVSEVCPFDVQGFIAAGLPGIAIGHNADVAWGWTTPYIDTADLVLEKVDGDSYLTEDGYVPLETRTETLRVAGGDPVEITLRSTRNGPLISSADVSEDFVVPSVDDVGEAASVPDDSPPRGDGYEVALRWTGSTPTRSVEAVFAWGAASNWEEFLVGVEALEAFGQNVVYADSAGSIGYYVYGSIPIRRGYDGSVPVPGWSDDYAWAGTVPFEKKPHVYQPTRGYLATANEFTVPQEYPYTLTTDAQFSYRGDRIRQFLDANQAVNVDDAAGLQMDSWNWLAERMVPELLEIEVDDFTGQALDLLAEWDLSQPPESAAAAYFNAVYAHTLALTFRDELPEEFWPSGRGRWFVVLDNLMQSPNDPWWDDVTTPQRESRDDILAAAMTAARDELTETQSKNVEEWEWGRMHQLDLVESAFGTSGIGPVEWLFNRGPYPSGGGGNIVQANSWDATAAIDDNDYTLVNIPVIRMVVDFADLDSSRWVNQSGQSGHPGHPHYDDQIAAWQTNEAPQMAWTDEAIRAEAEHTLVLTPAPA